MEAKLVNVLEATFRPAGVESALSRHSWLKSARRGSTCAGLSRTKLSSLSQSGWIGRRILSERLLAETLLFKTWLTGRLLSGLSLASVWLNDRLVIPRLSGGTGLVGLLKGGPSSCCLPTPQVAADLRRSTLECTVLNGSTLCSGSLSGGSGCSRLIRLALGLERHIDLSSTG